MPEEGGASCAQGRSDPHEWHTKGSICGLTALSGEWLNLSARQAKRCRGMSRQFREEPMGKKQGRTNPRAVRAQLGGNRPHERTVTTPVSRREEKSRTMVALPGRRSGEPQTLLLLREHRHQRTTSKLPIIDIVVSPLSSSPPL